MKHNHFFLIMPLAPAPTRLHKLRLAIQRQSRFSLALTGTVALLVLAMALDRPVQTLADAMDPTTRQLLFQVTRPGNSAWPLGIGLALLGPLVLALRQAVGRQRLALLRVRAELAFFLGSIALSGTIAVIAKNVIGRARPTNTQASGIFDFAPLTTVHSWASFPSGHATTATAMMLAMALILPRHALGFLTFGLLVAFSRALIGVHWLSDVVAGVALGAAVTLMLRLWLDNGRLRPRLGPRTTRLVLPALRSAGRTGFAALRAWVAALKCQPPK
ncbi:MAG: phosphatase PAP2 family protein [Rhodobacteraceae bacterium]|nr:phosphatase PAP2 family protein [Paracoccaceae bacterium]